MENNSKKDQKLEHKIFNMVFENSKDAIFIIKTVDGRHYLTNKAASEMLGYTKEELENMSYEQVVSKTYQNDSKKKLEQIIKGKQFNTYEKKFIRKDKTEIDVEISLSQIYDETNNIKYFLSIVRDITQRKEFEKELENNYINLKQILSSTVEALGNIIEKKDPYTSQHQKNVSFLSKQIGKDIGLNQDEIQEVITASRLHDIGKIAVPSEILNKPGKLKDYEMEFIKIHPEVGKELIENIKFSKKIPQIVYEHHERLDGKGYPRGIKNPLIESRIVSVCDVFDAICSHRPYRPALGLNYAMDELISKENICYDKKIVNSLKKILDKNLNEITKMYQFL